MVKNFAEILMFYSNKYSLISKLAFFEFLCDLFSNSEKGFYRYLLYSTLLLTFLYDLNHKQFYFIILLFQKYRKFLSHLDYLNMCFIFK